MVVKLKILRSFYTEVPLLGDYPRETFANDTFIKIVHCSMVYSDKKSLRREMYVVYIMECHPAIALNKLELYMYEHR